MGTDPQDPGQGQSEADQAQTSQQEATQDSGLQTEQPDQQIPTEAERQAQDPAGTSQAETVPDAAQAAAPVQDQTAQNRSYPSNDDLQAQEEQSQQEREAAQREHNERTGGGDVREGELEAQRQEHNERTGGGDQA